MLPQAEGEMLMHQSEMVALIRGGVPGPAGVWADFGAGTGNFSWALAELIGAGGTIYAIDRDAKAIRQLNERMAQADPGATIIPQQADLTRRLDLPALDGVLMANSLHFVRDQAATLALVGSYLRPGGRLLLVEYDPGCPTQSRSRAWRSWRPRPVSNHPPRSAGASRHRRAARCSRR
jgi:SAM-dependent methyltransferase